MTISEIIKNLLDQAEDRESSIDPEDPEDIFRLDARALREAARLLGKMEPPDVPLTLEQLREMDGEPVWTSWPGHSSEGWALVRVWSKSDNIIYLTYNNGVMDLLNFVLDNGAKVYCRRPEEALK